MLTVTVLHFQKNELTDKCIDSIDKQELLFGTRKLVIDNGSEIPYIPPTGWNIKRFEKGNGNIGGQNRCFDAANTDWVMFVSNDVIFKEGAISALFAHRLVYKHAGQIQPVTDNYGMNYFWPGYGLNRKRFELVETPITPSITYLMKKSVWEEVGGFDETLPNAYEDVDMGLRLKKAGYKNYVVLTSKGTHLGNATLKYSEQDKWRFRKARQMVIKKHYKGIDKFLRLLAIKVLDRLNRIFWPIIVIMLLTMPSVLLALAPPSYLPKESSAASLGEDAFQKTFRFAVFLHQEVSPKHPVRILDVGCGFGSFIPKIRKLFESFGYNVRVEGLDDLSIFTLKVKNGNIYYDESDKYMIDQIGYSHRTKIWHLDIAEAYKKIPHNYHFIFINAPYPLSKESDEKFIKGSYKLLEPNGILFVRYHEGEIDAERLGWLIEFATQEKMFIDMRNTSNVLPEGMYPLQREWTFIIRRKPYEGNPDSTGLSLGELGSIALRVKEINISA